MYFQAELFTTPDHGPTNIIEPEAGGSVSLYPSAMARDEADRLYEVLLDTIPWQARDIQVFGKRHRQPRLIAWHGDEGIRYRYSGDTLEASPWTEPLQELRQRCETISGSRFNSVLLNLYRDGNDCMGWHADDEPELGHEPVIASLTLGCPRRFDLRHRMTKASRQIVLPHGSVLIMAGKTQQHWLHRIARSKKITAPRINLTFRLIRQPT